MKIHEHDLVVLTRDLADSGLKSGDIGTVVHVHDRSAGYEVEFLTLCGTTVAVITLRPHDVRTISQYEIAHARSLHAVGSSPSR
jgi:hypothetical protein